MTSRSALWMMVLAAMFVLIDGNTASSPSDQEVEARCQNDRTAVFPHPAQCQLYYNCSSTQSNGLHPSSKYLEQCDYPDLFSTVTSRCEPFEDVTCGNRVELTERCYFLRECHEGVCSPCPVARYPSCKGLPDGPNVYPGKEWNIFYMVCRSGRTMPDPQRVCPKHTVLQMAKLFHPDKRRCVSLYEIPRERGGYQLDCSNKEDGLHLDDVTRRPDVFYRCDGGKFAHVDRCLEMNGRKLYFDEESKTCSVNPRVNSIMGRPVSK